MKNGGACGGHGANKRSRSLVGGPRLDPRRRPRHAEFRLHCAVADLIRRTLAPDWRWTYLPFGEYRLPSTAAKLARMDVTPGWPDFLFVSERGRGAFLELKQDVLYPTVTNGELRSTG